MRLDEYMSLDAAALAELVERKQVKPAELVALARRRADTVNPRLNAIVRRLDDVADRQAADPDLGGAFAGVPFVIKDLDQEYRGFPTSVGLGRWPMTWLTVTPWSRSGSWPRAW